MKFWQTCWLGPTNEVLPWTYLRGFDLELLELPVKFWLGLYLWMTVALSCGLLWSCQGREPKRRDCGVLDLIWQKTTQCEIEQMMCKWHHIVVTTICECSNDVDGHLIELAWVGWGVSTKRGRLQTAMDFNNQSRQLIFEVNHDFNNQSRES